MNGDVPIFSNCVCSRSIAILLNVARHDHLATAVAAVSDSTETLIDLLQMFRDKPQVFCPASELLGRLVKADDTVKVTVLVSIFSQLTE